MTKFNIKNIRVNLELITYYEIIGNIIKFSTVGGDAFGIQFKEDETEEFDAVVKKLDASFFSGELNSVHNTYNYEAIRDY